MKTWIKRSLIGLAGTAVLLGGIAACTHRLHGHGFGAVSDDDINRWQTRMVARAGSKLALDDAQRVKLTALGEALQAQRRALLGPDRADPRAEFQALLAGGTLDRERALALVQAKTGAVQTQAPALVAAAANFFDSLNPAQQQQVRDLLARGREHRR